MRKSISNYELYTSVYTIVCVEREQNQVHIISTQGSRRTMP